jgi:hypothetical protein
MRKIVREIKKKLVVVMLICTSLCSNASAGDISPTDMALLTIFFAPLLITAKVIELPGELIHWVDSFDDPVMQVHYKVVDNEGNGIEDALIRGRYYHAGYKKFKGTTDSSGKFIFEKQATKVLRVSFVKNGYKAVRQEANKGIGYLELEKQKKKNCYSNESNPIVLQITKVLGN